MKFVCFTEWDQLPVGADALLGLSEKQSVFISRDWFEVVTSTLVAGEQSIVLACVESADSLLAMMPLIKNKGSTLSSLKHRYTPHYSLLLVDENQEEVLACLVSGLSELSPAGLLFEPIVGSDNKMVMLQRAMEEAGYHCERIFRHYNWIHRVQRQTLATYMAERPARLRNTISRKKRKLEREHGYSLRVYTGDDVISGMADYYAVHDASWKATEQYTDFLNSLVAKFSRQGWTQLALLYIEGKPAAAQLWFVHHGKVSIFRLSYDERWKQYSPGSILTDFMMESVFVSNQVAEIDFLTGNEAYKSDWMSERRECFALSCVRQVSAREKKKGWLNPVRRLLCR